MDPKARLRREFECMDRTLRVISSEPWNPDNATSRQVSPDGIRLYNALAKQFNSLFPDECLMTFREDSQPSWVTYPKCQELLGQVELGLDVLKGGSVESRIEVNPVFARRSFTSSTDMCFVLMPFREDTRPIYDDHIVKVTHSLGLTPKRADDVFNTSSIIEDIWESIVVSRLIIADLTGKNPNVFYETGIAHTLGKTVILITQSIDDVPFDLRHLRHIQYEYTPRGMHTFESQLRQTITVVLGGSGPDPNKELKATP
jgi:hypothetical protein